MLGDRRDAWNHEVQMTTGHTNRIRVSVDWEAKLIEGIKRGIDDAKAGRMVPHEAAMAEIDAVIEALEAERTGKV
jgi:predicted transcriptional regulator